MRKKTYLLAALIVAALCVVLIVLGVRHSAALPTGGEGGEAPSQEETAAPITATLAVCGDIMSHSPQTNDAYDAATDTYSY